MRHSYIFTAAVLAAGLAQANSLVAFDAGSVAYDVSANGQAVVGSISGQDFLWTTTTGVTLIGGVAPGAAGTGGRVQISADGSRIAGEVLNTVSGRYESAYYTPATGAWTPLGGIGAHSFGTDSTTWGMSSSGRYVVGAAAIGSISNSATIFDLQNGTALNVGNAATGRINSISEDGRVAAGFITGSRNGTVWRDPEGDGSYVQSAILLNGQGVNEAIAVSNNGQWVVGASFNTGLPYLMNTVTGAVQTFPKLPYVSPINRSVATPGMVADDGQTIIGTHSVQGTLDTNRGFIWTATGGVQELDLYFAGLGIDTQNSLNFISPLAMSADGSTIVGIALDNASGTQRGFLVNISAVPEPGSYALFGVGLALVAAASRRRTLR